jgi:alcohol dehydrogenase
MQTERVGVLRRDRVGVTDQIGDLVEEVHRADRRQVVFGRHHQPEAVTAGGVGVEERLAPFNRDLVAALDKTQDELIDVGAGRAGREDVSTAARRQRVGHRAGAIGLEELDEPVAQPVARTTSAESGNGVVAVVFGAQQPAPLAGGRCDLGRDDLDAIDTGQHASESARMKSMATARALVLERPRQLVPREIEIPEPKPDGAVLRVEACGLCGTDHELYTGTLPLGFAFIPGHETVGVIDAIGDEAGAAWGVAAGDRVAVEPLRSCRQCDACNAGAYGRCAVYGLRDGYGMIPLDRDPGLWGGYATHHYLGPGTMLHRVPDALEPVLATMFNPLGAGVRWGVTIPGPQPGGVVAVLGPGVRGLAALVATKEAGAAFVAVTGYGERDHSRLELAARFGADLTIDVAVDDPGRALKKATGGLADLVVDVTAGAPAAFAQAVAMARPGGTIVVAGTRGFGHGTPGFEPDVVVFKELRIQGALGVDAPAYDAAFDLLASGKYPFADVPRQVADLDHAEDLILTMAGEGDAAPPLHGVLVP